MAKHHNPQSLAPQSLTKDQKQRLADAALVKAAQSARPNEPQLTIEFDPETVDMQHDLLLVELLTDKKEDDPASKIVLPDIAVKPVKDRDKLQLVVRKVGPGYHTDFGFFVEQKRSPGEIILIRPMGGFELPPREDKREFMVCRQNEVVMVIGRVKEEPTMEALVKEHGIEN